MATVCRLFTDISNSAAHAFPILSILSSGPTIGIKSLETFDIYEFRDLAWSWWVYFIVWSSYLICSFHFQRSRQSFSSSTTPSFPFPLRPKKRITDNTLNPSQNAVRQVWPAIKVNQSRHHTKVPEFIQHRIEKERTECSPKLKYIDDLQTNIKRPSLWTLTT